ncbi:dynamin family protein [Brachybacterium fresconis]|uniref:GTP-binding protein EngB required for normal cell division n=1 Tax=Brachybacterium fresconis TaxID=173363 RepID=A0ABS4YIN8_9MICO|nr:dynamin family protein [Brachybacterium fresconis]MBP2408614.1 GTP-binding protein EngB required for normal cell division [Brachybacterium fresconis]
MSPLLTRSAPAPAPLAERLDALTRAADALDGIAPGGEVEAAREVLSRIDRRRALSAEHTVIGLFGATGSGKSSLINALVGTDISRAAVRRPTTSAPVAAVLGAADSDALLDWLEVEDRHHLDGTGTALEAAAEPGRRGRRARRRDPGAAPGIVLLDLPDLDSIQAGNRAIAERMTGLVDVLVWVTDPQKYADAVLHQEFVRRFAGHDAVTVLVLNQLDRLREQEREGVLDSLTRIASDDGLEEALVVGTSASTGEGIEDLREHLVGLARSREAAAARQRADVREAAERLQQAADPDGLPADAATEEVDLLVEDLATAARVDPVARAVGASYRFRAAGRVGWPVLRWARRMRPDPLRRLGIAAERDGEGLERTSLPEPDAAARARASGGVRQFADAASAGGSDPWRAAVRGAARSREDELPDALDQAVAGADLRARGSSWWWPVLDVLQWLAMLTWVVGLGWLTLNVVLALLQIPPPPMPMIEDLWIPIPLPTALLVLGIAAGIVIGAAGGGLAALTAIGHRRRARRVLRARVQEVALRLVVEEVDAELARAQGAARDLALAHGDPPGRPV